MTEPAAIWRRVGDTVVPTGHARSPWDDAQVHGGAPGGLLAEAIRALDPGPRAMRVVRLTYEFAGPVPLVPMTLHAEVTRPGKRLQVAEGELRDAASGATLLRVRAVRLRCGAVDVPPVARAAGPEAIPGGPDPLAFPPEPFPGFGSATEGFHITGMEMRYAQGTYAEEGPGATWFRARHPLVDDEPPSPLARTVMAADFGNGVSRVLRFEDHLFVNTDLTVHLVREPVGEWVLVDARTAIDPAGIGLAESRLFDVEGFVGIAAQSLFVAPR